MTNYEHYKKDIDNFSRAVTCWGLEDGKTISCTSASNCEKCQFYKPGLSCGEVRLDWLTEEYKEPGTDWSKVPVDTKILVSKDGALWLNRHFSSYDGQCVSVFADGLTSWSGRKCDVVKWPYAKLAEEE